MRAPAPSGSAPGFTLVELVVAVGVTAVLIAAAMSLMISQQNAFRVGAEDRALQETARIAMAELTDNLRSAGYGLDPAYALDFGQTDPVPQPALTGGQLAGALSSYKCDTAIECRDRIDAPDEIVFYTRDPLFSRVATAVSTTSITFRGQLEQPLRKGQVLQVMCLSGGMVRAYVTVGATVAGAIPADSSAAVVVELADPVAINGRDAFPFQNPELADSCFTSGTVTVAKIDRFRYHIVSFGEPGTSEEGKSYDPALGDEVQTANTRPFLMLDQGLRDDKDQIIDTPVAPDVEDLQLTYLYPPAATGGALREVGGAEGTLADADAFPMQVVTPPAITDPPSDAHRGTGSPVNIQAVRVSLVVRSPPDAKYAQAEERRIPPTPASGRAAGTHDALANRASYTGLPMYRRLRLDTTILIPNLRNTAVTYCVVDPTGAIAGANYGGC